MNKLSRAVVGVLLFGSGLGVGLLAQTGGDFQLRKELRRTDLTGAPNMEVILSTTEIKPGEVVPAHFHNGVEAVYVVQGSTIQLPGKDPTQMATGSNGLNLRDVVHGGFKNVGQQPLVLFSVHVTDKGKALYEFKS
jgi:quercetin dioxygenase-like cupin family protein